MASFPEKNQTSNVMNIYIQIKPVLFALALTVALFAEHSNVRAQVIYSDHNNAAVASSDNSVNATGNWELWAGGTPWLTANAPESSVVLAFQLPSLGNVSNPFSTATLGITFFGKDGTPTGDVDLYGLGVRGASAVLGSDYFSGALDGSAGVTLLENNIMTPSTPAVAADSANNVFSTDLAGYLNTAYAGGADAGQYVLLRLSYDQSGINSDTCYHIESNPGSGTPNDYPQINYTLTPAPEPSAMALCGLGGLCMAVMVVRRRC